MFTLLHLGPNDLIVSEWPDIPIDNYGDNCERKILGIYIQRIFKGWDTASFKPRAVTEAYRHKKEQFFSFYPGKVEEEYDFTWR